MIFGLARMIAIAAIVLPLLTAPVISDGLMLQAAPGPAALDGPYVTALGDGRWAARWAGAAGARGKILRSRGLTVSRVGVFPAFEVVLRRGASPAQYAVDIDVSTPLFVMADTHGEFEIAATLLFRQGVIDRDLRWSFDTGHLIVTGDMLDRGPNQIELLWLLYSLEGQAAAAGGRVHILLGNHEAMVMRGDLRYLNPRYVRTAEALGVASYAGLLGPQTVLGQWLRSKPTVLKLGDMLFMHGGFSPELVRSGLTIEQVNDVSRRALDVPIAESDRLDETARLVTGPQGPLWYRGYFAGTNGFTIATATDIDESLSRFGARRIFVGHTTVPSVTLLHGGRVVAVQVYPERDEQSGAFIMEGAMRENGNWYRARVDGTREPLGLE